MNATAEVRPATFEAWLRETLDADQISDLADHGADTGWPGLTYNADVAETFDVYAEEIWDLAAETAEEMGEPNVAALVSKFQRADMLGSYLTFKVLMVWFAAETIANRITEE